MPGPGPDLLGGRRPPGTPWQYRLGTSVAWALVFAAAVHVGRSTVVEGSSLALVWPAAGVAVLWLSGSWGRPGWRVVDAALLLAVTVLGTAWSGASPMMSLLLAASALLQAAVTLGLLARLAPGWRLRTPGDLGALALASVAGAAAGGLLASTVISWTTGQPWFDVVGPWVLRNSVSAFVVSTAGLRIRGRRLADLRLLPGRVRSCRCVLELAMISLAFLAAYALAYDARGVGPLAWLIVPLAVWLGLRVPTSVVAVYGLLNATVVVVLTWAGRGPFAVADPTERVLLAQAFIAVVVLVSLLLAVGRDERRALVDELSSAHESARAQSRLLETVISSISDGVTVVEPDGRFVLANPAARRLLGVDVDGVAGRETWSERFGTFDLAGHPVPSDQLPLVRALTGQDEASADVVIRNPEVPDGRVLNVRARRLSDGSGTTGAVAAFHDVTEQRRAARETAEARDLFAAVLASATEQAIIATDATGSITVFNVGARRLTEQDEQGMRGRPMTDLHDPDEVAARAAELGVPPGFEVLVHAARRGLPETREWTYVRRTGPRVTVRLSVTAMHDPAGDVVGFIGVATDITAQLQAQAALSDSEQRFRTAFVTAPMGMLIATVADEAGTGRLLSVNPALCRLLQRPPADLVRAGLLPSVADGSRPALLAALAALRDGAVATVSLEIAFRRPGGDVAWAMLSASIVQPSQDGRDRQDGRHQVMGLVEDITARKDAEAALRHQALHDQLTGLANRALLRTRLDLALEQAARSGLRVGVLYLDLDGFKSVNDQGGHAAGDALLQAVGDRLVGAVRPGDTVARLGGDEFVVLCPDVGTTTEAQAVAAQVLAALDEPFRVPTGLFRVRASMGLTTAAAGASASQLLLEADEAMYQAKRDGKGHVSLYTGTRQARSDHDDRLLTELPADRS